MKKLISLVMALTLMVSAGMAAAAEENEIAPYAAACSCGGQYSASRTYWDYDNYTNMRNCVYGQGVTKDYKLIKYKAVVCNRCGDEYSSQAISTMWYCPVKSVFYS